MSTLELVFQGTSYPVPKKYVFELVEKHQDLNVKRYEVQSSVPAAIFDLFADSLKNQKPPTVTKENAASLLLLAKEFCLEDLASVCETFSVLSDRLTKLEEQIGGMSKSGAAQGELVKLHEERLETLSSRFESLEGKLSRTGVLFEVEVEGSETGAEKSLLSLREGLEKLVGRTMTAKIPPPLHETDIRSLRKEVGEVRTDLARKLDAQIGSFREEVREVHRELSELKRSLQPILEKLEKERLEKLRRDSCAWKEQPKSLEGIISYLTKKHGGNVHEKGIVTVTAKSVVNNDPRCAADFVTHLTGFYCDQAFPSANAPRQWVCLDFHEIRVRPTHYTITGYSLKSWVVEGSLDGECWTEMDRQTDTEELRPAPRSCHWQCQEISETAALVLM
jgi:archaellum component FlaC